MKPKHVVWLAVAFFVGLVLFAFCVPLDRNPPAVEDPRLNHLRGAP